MVRWMNVDLDNTKAVMNALTKVFGIGFWRAKHLCNSAGVTHNTKVSELRPWHYEQFLQEIARQNWILQDDLKKQEYDNIVLLQKIKHLRGYRHSFKLPVHGQDTKTNAKTQRVHMPRRGEKMDWTPMRPKPKK